MVWHKTIIKFPFNNEMIFISPQNDVVTSLSHLWMAKRKLHMCICVYVICGLPDEMEAWLGRSRIEPMEAISEFHLAPTKCKRKFYRIKWQVTWCWWQYTIFQSQTWILKNGIDAFPEFTILYVCVCLLYMLYASDEDALVPVTPYNWRRFSKSDAYVWNTMFTHSV